MATTIRSVLLWTILFTGLGWYYYAGALAHARVVNTIKARGDQSAYLWEAQLLYKNWHRLADPPVVQPRNRMPLYPAFLATFYEPRWSDPEFFEIGKVANIYLSMVLLAMLTVVVRRELPALPALNLVLVIAFGCFIFKAGYTQSELLFYTLHFLAFVACWNLFLERASRTRLLATACAAGLLSALAYLAKAATLPFVALVVVTYFGGALVSLVATRDVKAFGWRTATTLMVAASFLAALYPYIATSKRIHGQYFYNLNTAALMWYDGYGQAAAAIESYGTDGWPRGPRSMRPGPQKYWREHSLAQITDRFRRGFTDMAVQSYRSYNYLKFVVLYLAAAVLIATRWKAVAGLIRGHATLSVLLVSYAAVYVPSIAFYEPTSGTGTARFLLAHLAPLMFAISKLLTSRAAAAEQWTLGRISVGVAHFHVLIAATMALDLAFVVPHRLMTTYGGF